MESIVKKRNWLIFMLVFLTLITALGIFRSDIWQPSEARFSLISLRDNTLLISDKDILSYNWTSQEMALTDGASQKLIQMGENLYSFTDGFVIKIDDKEVYQGVFRSPIMSAIPAPPKISIMFPSMLFPSESENHHAIRMFYPDFQPPNNQQEKNSKLSQCFEEINKLTY
jgi:hypothetical protein